MEDEGPVPAVWRPTLAAIVDSLVRGDSIVAANVTGVDPVSADLSRRLYEAVNNYGGVSLAPLPEDTWSTSVAIWIGSSWGCLIDLWTKEEGRSDLVLEVKVFERGTGYRYAIHLLYVP